MHPGLRPIADILRGLAALIRALSRWAIRRLRRYQIGALRLKGIPLRGVKQLSTKEIQSLFAVPRSHYRDGPAPAHDEN